MRIKLIALAAAAAAVLALPGTATAGDWSVRVTLGGHGHHHRRPAARVVYRAPVRRAPVYRAPVYRAPVRRAPTVQRGHWEVRRVNVWVPGYHERIVRPAVYETQWHAESCSWVQVLVRPKRVRLVWVPGHHEVRRKRVWVPAPPVCAI